MKPQNVLVLNGPNLDMLGVREPEVYGRITLEDIENCVTAYAEQFGVHIECKQSNSEGELVDTIHTAPSDYDAIVYNPGAHTHYSYALRDAVAAIDIPVIEVHLSDVAVREEFRRVSVIAPMCRARLKGLGVDGYLRAIDILLSGKQFKRLGDERGSQAAAANVIVGEEEEPADANAPVIGAIEQPSTTGAVESGDVEQLAAMGETPLGAASEPAPEPEPEPEPEPMPTVFPVPDAIEPEAVDVRALSIDRLGFVSQTCKRLGIGSLLVRDTSNIQWLTAFDGVFDEERAHALLVADDRAFLHTDSRYSNALRTVAQSVGSDVEIDDERLNHAQFAFNVLAREGLDEPGVKLGIEDTITYAEFVKVVETFTADRLAPTTEVVLGLRAVKDEGEIARMKAAQAITDAAFSHIIGFMRPGMTEREVQLELESYLLRHGAEGLAFRSIVATGPNGADPHAVPGQTRLEAGQCVVMDFGAKAHGYCSDMTRTVFLGQPDGLMASAWETLRRANEQVEELLRPGVTGAAAHEHAEQVLAEGGFADAMGHGLGHGVGIDVHELPVLNPRNNAPLVEGNVVTVEPGIYLPGRFGMRLEDFGVITATGFDVFTQSTHEMVVI